MQVDEARKKLGKTAEGLTDKEVLDLVNRMDALSNFMIDFILDQIKMHRKEGETANDCLKRLNKMWKNKHKSHPIV